MRVVFCILFCLPVAEIALASPLRLPVWDNEQKVSPVDANAGDGFGTSVAVRGSTAVVSTLNASANQGAVYIYVKNGSGAWLQSQKLTPSDGAAGDQFGLSLAFDGTTILVGAKQKTVGSNPRQGAVYVFQYIGGAWQETQRLTTGTPVLGDPDGLANDFFGASVSVSESYAAIGASSAHNGGAVYVFSRSPSGFCTVGGPCTYTWTESAQLLADDRGPGEGFGSSVSIDGNSLAIGASSATVSAVFGVGAAYIFDKSPSCSGAACSWTQTQRIIGTNLSSDMQFGSAISMRNGTVVVGAPYALVVDPPYTPYQGSAYVFSRASSGVWSQDQRLVASDGAARDHFGKAVAFDGNTVLVGAGNVDVGANTNQGAAYAYQHSGAAWAQIEKIVASDGVAHDEFGGGYGSVGVSGADVVIGAPHYLQALYPGNVYFYEEN